MYLFTRFAATTGKYRTLVKTIVAAICTVMLSAPASAGSTYGGVIVNIVTNTDLGYILILTNGTPNGRPTCAAGSLESWAIALNAANNQVYAQLLTAYATQANVYMWGDGACSINSGIETLVQFQMGGSPP
jgi:hypothetical protein